MDVTADLEADAFPACPRYERHTQPSDHLMTRNGLELVEYFVVSREAISAKLREYEAKLIKQFINNMSKADQKSALVESLNKTSWTWQSVEKATKTILLAEQKQREADEEARRIAADEAASEAQQPRQKANAQRRKRKRKNW